MIYSIVAYGDQVLKKPAKDIEKGKIDVKQLAADMFETMYQARGVGLAAPQIGMGIRMFVADATDMEREDAADFKRVFVNPVILKEEGNEWSYEEGCLSIPGVRAQVSRQEKLTIKYFDENWEEHTEEFDGISARIIQHEYDHIEGILFIDYLPSIKKRLLKGKFLNISKGNVDVEYKMKFPLR